MFHINKSKKDDLDLPLFDFATILDATNNFSLSNKLGEGGFGPVYKVMMLTAALPFFSKQTAYLQYIIYDVTFTNFQNL